MKLQVAGQRPTIITSQVAANQEALAQRGILELHADEHPYAAPLLHCGFGPIVRNG